MKRNVDLTEDRLFTTPEEPTGITKILFDWFADQQRKPWEFNITEINSELDFECAILHPPLIATGDKADRERWYRAQKESADEICDHCGQDKGKLPWAKKKCNCYAMTFERKIPWDFQRILLRQ